MQRSVTIIVPVDSEAAEVRAAILATALRGHGHRVTLLRPRPAARHAFGDRDCVISLSPSTSAHTAAYAISRRGTPWLADLESIEHDEANGTRDVDARARLARRVIMSADGMTCGAYGTQRVIFDRLGASAAVVGPEAGHALDRQIEALSPGHSKDSGSRLRILMIGPVNSPHMEDLALRMEHRGHTVRAGGAVWGGGLPPSSLPDAGIPTSAMTWPQPVWLRGLLRRFRPDVIHANWMPFAALGALAGARPLVAMAWGSDVYLAERMAVLANRVAVRRADSVLADSSALVERLVELGAPRERAGLLNWGVELETFKPVASGADRAALRESLGLGEGPVLISPRGLKSLYNPGVVIEAFERLSSAFPDVQLVLKHQSEEPPDLGALAGNPHVHVVGRVPYDRMADYFRAADVCVSIPDTDSSPRSVWEAMACGSACVLSDLPWVHELIRDGEHALVVPVRAADVAEAIRRLLTEPDLREALARNGRRLVEQHRNAAAEMDRLEALYLRLAGRRPDVGGPASIAASSAAASSPVSVRRE
ncbi:MAG: glycosyltransferase family 4 protein [Solirubrobacteraceae bacterium]